MVPGSFERINGRKLFGTERVTIPDQQITIGEELKTKPNFRMGFHAMTAVFLLSYLCIPEEAMGGMSNSKSRLREVERRHQLGRLSLSNDLLTQGKEGLLAKRRQEQQFDDYGHMRFGKRGEGSEDYGHMRFGKRD